MDIEEYDKKIEQLLKNFTSETISSDPTTYLEQTTNAKIKASKISREK